jgi:uncharacterized membrane protein
MENMLVTVFDNEGRARLGFAALEALANDDTIGVNAAAIVTKTDAGAISVSSVHRPAPEGTLAATALGMFIGILAGPVGLAVGLATGLAAGAATDRFDRKVERDFLADVERALERGKSAVVAQIYEEETYHVNTRMAGLGGIVFRRALTDVADKEYRKGIGAVKRRITERRHV